MLGFEYEYQNVYHLLWSLKLEWWELFYLPFLFFVYVLAYAMVYILGPVFYIYRDFRIEQKIKRKKKQFIERIKLQNEIEDEVEKELK